MANLSDLVGSALTVTIRLISTKNHATFAIQSHRNDNTQQLRYFYIYFELCIVVSVALNGECGMVLR